MSLYEVLFGNDKDIARVKGRGVCMYPLIREGDDIFIKRQSMDQIAVGEIAVFMLGDAVAAHRVIGKGEKNGKPCLFTRGDNNAGRGEIVFDDILIGAVKEVHRRGQKIVPGRKKCSSFQRQINTWRLDVHRWYVYNIRPWLITLWAGLRLSVFNCWGSRLRYPETPASLPISFDMPSKLNMPWLKVIKNTDIVKDPLLADKLFWGRWQMTFADADEVFGFFTFHRQKDQYPNSAFLTHLYINSKYWRTPTARQMLQKIDAFCRLVGLETLYAAAATWPGKRFLKDLDFLPTESEVDIWDSGFFEYLGPQSLPKSYPFDGATFFCHRVPSGEGREKDMAIFDSA